MRKASACFSTKNTLKHYFTQGRTHKTAIDDQSMIYTLKRFILAFN